MTAADVDAVRGLIESAHERVVAPTDEQWRARYKRAARTNGMLTTTLLMMAMLAAAGWILWVVAR